MTTFNTVVDSGKREEMSTGSVRDSRDGKGRFDLLSTHALRRDAKHMENGAKKYGDRNWEKGQPISRFYDSAMRHMVSFLEGKTDEDHLSAARWNIACIVHMMEEVKLGNLPESLIDLPKWKTQNPPQPQRRYFDWADRQDDFGTGGYWTIEPQGNVVMWSQDGKSSYPSWRSVQNLQDRRVFEERSAHAPF